MSFFEEDPSEEFRIPDEVELSPNEEPDFDNDWVPVIEVTPDMIKPGHVPFTMNDFKNGMTFHPKSEVFVGIDPGNPTGFFVYTEAPF